MLRAAVTDLVLVVPLQRLTDRQRDSLTLGLLRWRACSPCFGVVGRSVARQRPDPIEQLKDREAQGAGNNFHRIEGGVRVTVLDAAQIGLIEAALLAELNLTQAGLCAEFSHALSKTFRQAGCHNSDCRCYALIRINTNSYKWRKRCSEIHHSSASHSSLQHP